MVPLENNVKKNQLTVTNWVLSSAIMVPDKHT